MTNPQASPAQSVRAALQSHGNPAPGAAETGGGDTARAPSPFTVKEDTRLRDRIVVLMMTLVAVASTGILHLQLGYPIPVAVVGGAAAWALFMVLHALVHKSSEIARLRGEVARLEHEIGRAKSQVPSTRSTSPQQAEGGIAWPARPAPEARAEMRGDPRGESRKPSIQPPPSGPQPIAPASAAPNASAAAAPAPAATPAGPAIDRPDDYAAMPQAAPSADPRWAAPVAPRRARLVPSAAGERSGNSGLGDARGDTRSGPGDLPGRDVRPAIQGPSNMAPGPAYQGDDHVPELSDVPGWSGAAQSMSDPVRDAWGFKPNETSAPRTYQQGAGADGDAARAPMSKPRIESDLEVVQRKIKALADEVNANEAARAVAEQPGVAIDESVAALKSTASVMKNPRAPRLQPSGTGLEAPQRASPRGREDYRDFDPPQRSTAGFGFDQPEPAPSSSELAPSRISPGTLPSLDALIPATAQTIAVSEPSGRSPRGRDPAEVPASAQPAYEPVRRDVPQMEPMSAPAPAAAAPRAPQNMAPAAQAYEQPIQQRQPAAPSLAPQAAPAAAPQQSAIAKRIAEIANAIETQRMDVFLNPIVGLGDYAVTHFEVAVRLRTAAGDYLATPDSSFGLEARDLLALFDVERLQRTAILAEQLEARGKTGSLLSSTTGQSMNDPDFLSAFARAFEDRTSISGQLVLTFTQADIAAFGPSAWQALSDMHSFGFRFALEQVTHLATDFAMLAERGFAFIKLPAQAFLDGLPAGHGMVPPADICRYMANAGLTLVVESIDDNALLARVFGFGALYGQGQLFGGARQITLEALSNRAA